MFEITSIAARDTFTLELRDPDDATLHDADGKAISVTVFGPGSKAYQKANAERNQRVFDRLAKKGKVKLSAKEQVRETAAFLAACTVSFNGWAYQGSSDAFEAAYSDPAIGFVADQVAGAIGDWSNFTSAQPSN